MRSLLAVLTIAAAAAWAQTPPPPPPAPAPDVAWPRERKTDDGTTITVYQPQLERWADNNLSGRAAVSVVRPGDKEPHFGVIELAAQDLDRLRIAGREPGNADVLRCSGVDVGA